MEAFKESLLALKQVATFLSLLPLKQVAAFLSSSFIFICNSPSYSTFKKNILNLIRPPSNDVFNVRHPKRLILLTRLRVGLNHLREHKFKHSFLDTLNPICNCGFDIETLNQFFLHCPIFTKER